MPELHRVLAAFGLWLGVLGAAQAGIADAPGAGIEVALVTYGPGDIYWERFGHDAIELRDRASGEAVAFNYGMFDFNQDNFLLNFARGRMRYTMDAVPSADDIAFYAGEGRSVRRQVLALSPVQAADLRDALLLNLQPRNAPYDYDYFRANCATRVRDALDAALGGQLRTAWQGRADTRTYRGETDRLMAPQMWLMLLIDLGLGPDADRPLDLWQAGFVPMTLADAVAHARIDDGHGGTRPLLRSDNELVPARLPPPLAQPPDFRLRFLFAGLIGGVLLIWAGRRQPHRGARLGFAMGASAFAVLAGIAGLGMTVLWAFTAHRSAWANQNLLLFNPLALALLPSLWRMRHAAFRPGRAAEVLVAILALVAAVALVGKSLGLPHQQNQAWIALALPIWCGIVSGLWQRRQGH